LRIHPPHRLWAGPTEPRIRHQFRYCCQGLFDSLVIVDMQVKVATELTGAAFLGREGSGRGGGSGSAGR
jgi:hypothetical protein